MLVIKKRTNKQGLIGEDQIIILTEMYQTLKRAIYDADSLTQKQIKEVGYSITMPDGGCISCTLNMKQPEIPWFFD